MIYYAVGDALISNEEMFEPVIFDKLTDFHSNILENNNPDSFSLSNGNVTLDNFLTEFDPEGTGIPVGFKPIGLGRPLTIMIREVYTGKYPKGWIGKKKDMLITSAIKSISTFEAKPQALNFLSDNVRTGSRIERPSAKDKGTPLIFYSPALLERSLTMDLSITFDNFSKDTFDDIGNFFTATAGIPIFVAHSAYLIGAGMLSKLVGSIGEAIFDGSPIFQSSEAIDIFLPGKPPMPPGFALVTSDNVDRIDPTFRDKYQVNKRGKVVDGKGNEYKGDIPYIVISLDGTKSEEFNSFTPTAASAAILSRFFGVKDKQGQSMDILLNALKLYNDFSNRKEIDKIDKRLENVSGEEKATLEKKREALLKNIFEELLKPKSD